MARRTGLTRGSLWQDVRVQPEDLYGRMYGFNLGAIHSWSQGLVFELAGMVLFTKSMTSTSCRFQSVFKIFLSIVYNFRAQDFLSNYKSLPVFSLSCSHLSVASC